MVLYSLSWGQQLYCSSPGLQLIDALSTTLTLICYTQCSRAKNKTLEDLIFKQKVAQVRFSEDAISRWLQRDGNGGWKTRFCSSDSYWQKRPGEDVDAGFGHVRHSYQLPDTAVVSRGMHSLSCSGINLQGSAWSRVLRIMHSTKSPDPVQLNLLIRVRPLQNQF